MSVFSTSSQIKPLSWRPPFDQKAGARAVPHRRILAWGGFGFSITIWLNILWAEWRSASPPWAAGRSDEEIGVGGMISGEPPLQTGFYLRLPSLAGKEGDGEHQRTTTPQRWTAHARPPKECSQMTNSPSQKRPFPPRTPFPQTQKRGLSFKWSNCPLAGGCLTHTDCRRILIRSKRARYLCHRRGRRERRRRRRPLRRSPLFPAILAQEEEEEEEAGNRASATAAPRPCSSPRKPAPPAVKRAAF